MDTELPLADELAAVFARFSNVLLTEETVANALTLITEAAVLAVGDAAGAGVSLLDAKGSRSSAASTSSIVARADSLQYELGQGPCLSAWASGHPVDIADVRTDLRWPEWGAAADELGLRSCVSVPLLSGNLAFGAIKIYWDKPKAASHRLIRLLELFAAQASIFLVNVQARDKGRMLSEQLKSTLAQRDVLSTAKGIVMSNRRIGDHDAMLHLMARALNEDRTLQEVAEDVIGSTPGLDT
ncbi:GAF and ANTAR domain-containing protein [Pseudarthrobacter sp. NamE5]|uniref:GAF and ANTAR domain-containing protein n=1 Tax=Pseudarthrobacter sp. NamE5 TaxID=2576839 RepID=UPI00110B32DE|nr:GAF and ANTAR domain-containing protein [Pseudarthrobacter sp. NamE5]TLM88212.1 GAF and ANTAR domain-containing protein [Pseudarthrobacter sp. NamE5]